MPHSLAVHAPVHATVHVPEAGLLAAAPHQKQECRRTPIITAQRSNQKA
jgi:hypothetical protein